VPEKDVLAAASAARFPGIFICVQAAVAVLSLIPLLAYNSIMFNSNTTTTTYSQD
jgi:hypothetical protein